ncbi:MAG TPA: hypothetical protein DD414_02875 [Lachnospiraceae bacterium]|nr:hypothetical protein [Lachnospiraceae bacterium]
MDIRTLNYFIQAAKTLNFTKAAKDCYISQTAMSLAISKLEDEVGYKLFDRSSRRIRLTPVGTEFYEWAVSTMDSYARITKFQATDSTESRLSIGFSNSYDALSLLPRLREFKKTHPNVIIEQRILSVRSMPDALADRKVDAIVLPPYFYENAPSVDLCILGSFPMKLVISKEHELAANKSVSIRKLRNYPCVILTYANMQQCEYTFSKHMEWEGIQFASITQLENIEEVFLYVLNNHAVAFLPDAYQGLLPHGLLSLPINKCSMNIPFAFCFLKDNDNMQVLGEFLPLLK